MTDTATLERARRAGRGRALAFATFAFAVNFWAWNLIGPLAPDYEDWLGLSSVAVATMVAVPVIVGSLGRIPVGALTDRFGGRLMFAVISFITAVPVFLLAVYDDSYLALIALGFLLGTGGTAFAVGVPFVNAWFPPERRGFALGVFGMGTGGTALSGFFTPRISDAANPSTAFSIVGVGLIATGVLSLLIARDAPGRQKAPAHPKGTRGLVVERLKAAGSLPVTWQLSTIYAATFGGFVAFSVYLPTYLKEVHDYSTSEAGARTAGFVIVAVIARPIGGWLSDRYGAVNVLLGVFSTVAVFSIVAAFEPELIPVGTAAFLIMGAALGAGAGATFALVAEVTPVEKVGSVTGIVGAAGGMGGFFPPIVMGAVYGVTDSYAIGFMLLSDTALACLVFTATVLTREVREHRAARDAAGVL